jgi:hypothetical protein
MARVYFHEDERVKSAKCEVASAICDMRLCEVTSALRLVGLSAFRRSRIGSERVLAHFV